VLYPGDGIATLRRIPWNQKASERAVWAIAWILKMDPSLAVQVS